MGEKTGIAWCDSTFNPWVGCTKVSPGCANCYAADYDRRVGGVPKGQRSDPSKPLLRWGKGAPRTRTSGANWKKPLAWNAKAKAAGTRPRVFCSSLADVFDDEVPREWGRDLADLIIATPNLDWLLLTKRPENFGRLRSMLRIGAEDRWARNVWLGVTVENQEQAERRIPLLLAEDATVRFLSMEPLLEAVNLAPLVCPNCGSSDVSFGEPGDLPWCIECEMEAGDPDWLGIEGINWAIIGGESGPQARPFDLAWAHSLVRQCRDAGVAPFVKQMGDAPIYDAENLPESIARKLDRRGMRLEPWECLEMEFSAHHGADPAEWPKDLRVQEFPR